MDVGLTLLGLFIEDIQMYSLRHQDLKISDFIEKIIKLDFSKSKILN